MSRLLTVRRYDVTEILMLVVGILAVVVLAFVF
jgi:hypothetical protein